MKITPPIKRRRVESTGEDEESEEEKIGAARTFAFSRFGESYHRAICAYGVPLLP